MAENPTVRDTAKMVADMESRQSKDLNPCITCLDKSKRRFSAISPIKGQAAILIQDSKVVAEN